MEMSKKLVAEAFGTFWLVFGGCGAAVLAAKFRRASQQPARPRLPRRVVRLRPHRPHDGLRRRPHLGRALQPRRHRRPVGRQALPDQGGAALRGGAGHRRHRRRRRAARRRQERRRAATTIDNSQAGPSPPTATTSSRPVATASARPSSSSCCMTFGFLFVILGATARKAHAVSGPMAIGFALVLIHLISIPVTNTSVNPARSTGPALFAGGDYIPQLWLFWLAPHRRCRRRRPGLALPQPRGRRPRGGARRGQGLLIHRRGAAPRAPRPAPSPAVHLQGTGPVRVPI